MCDPSVPFRLNVARILLRLNIAAFFKDVNIAYKAVDNKNGALGAFCICSQILFFPKKQAVVL